MAKKLKRMMQKIMLNLRQQQEQFPKLNYNKPVIYKEEANFRGKAYDVPLFIMRTTPCFWLKAGGCSVCNYHLGSAMNYKVSHNELLLQIDEVIRYINGRELPYILFTTSGSFLDDKEIPEDIRLYALKKTAKTGLKRLSFECRAEFLVNRNRLRKCVEVFEGGQLQAGIGLESTNPFVRNIIIHKGLQDSVISKAIDAMRNEGIGYYFYIMLGKPFMTPKEDFWDTVKSIRNAFDLGANMVVLEMINVQPFTLTNLLYNLGLYKPPSLWLAIEVLRIFSNDMRRKIAIKGFEKAAPTPLVFSDTCVSCREKVKRAIQKWNYTREWSVLKDINNCDCYNRFLKSFNQDIQEESLDRRVEKNLYNLIEHLDIKVGE